MRKMFSILCLFALMLGFVAGEKRVVGTKINNQIMLLRVDLANYAMDCSTDGTTWSAIPGTSGAALLSGADFTGNVSIAGTTTLSGLTATTVPYLNASKVMTSSAVTPTELGYLSGVTSAIQTQLGAKAASGANSDITSITGLTTALSITQGGTGLNTLGTAGQVLTVNSGATAAEWATPPSASTAWGDIAGKPLLPAFESTTVRGFPQIPVGFADVTSGGVTKWLLNNSLTDSFGSYTLTNHGITFSSDSSYTLGTSYVGVLNGSSYASFDPAGLPSGTTDRTVCFRLKTTMTDSGIIIAYGNRADGQLFAPLCEDGILKLAGQGSAWTVSSALTINDGSWHSCVITLSSSGTVVNFYVDNFSASGSVGTAYNTVLTEGVIGRYAEYDGLYYSGSIADVRVYNRVLDGPEITAYIQGASDPEYVAPSLSTSALTGAEQLVYRNPADMRAYYKAFSDAVVMAPSSPAQGDILYYSGSAWAKLAAGTSGQYLQTQGASSNPQWATVTGTGGLLKSSGSGYALDNGSTGRGTIGTKSVSLEYSPEAVSSGATGNYAVVGGGESTRASGDHCVVSGGENNTASGYNSFVGGGYTNVASGTGTSIAGGNQNTTSGFYTSIPGGYGAKAEKYGEFAMASGYFGALGDCQRGNVQARIATSSSDAAILYLDGPSEKFSLVSGDHYSCRVHLIGAQSDGSTGDYYALVKIKNVGGTTSLSGTVRVLEAWEGDTNLGTPTISITADDTNDCLQISVTPANATATRWTAVIEYVKINY